MFERQVVALVHLRQLITFSNSACTNTSIWNIGRDQVQNCRWLVCVQEWKSWRKISSAKMLFVTFSTVNFYVQFKHEMKYSVCVLPKKS